MSRRPLGSLRSPHSERRALLIKLAAYASKRRPDGSGVEASDGGDGQTAVILSPERPAEAHSVPSSWPLTRQERLVVRCLLAGSRTRQIADQLQLAPSTVKSHLAHVYEKLGTSGRGGLLACYLRDGLNLREPGRSRSASFKPDNAKGLVLGTASVSHNLIPGTVHARPGTATIADAQR
jgi:DNA-binding CsgD family transcriptional regulator